MNHKITLTITSLLSIFLFELHWVDEITRGMEAARLANLPGVLILVVWLYGTLVLAGRRSGYIIMLLGSVLAAGVLVLHMSGAGLVNRRILETGRIFFWVWTMITLGVTGSITALLSAHALWRSSRASAAARIV